MQKNKKQQSGFSLPELMLAMALSLLLVLGISTVFVSIKSTSVYSQQLENTQEVLRFTSSIFSRAIHRADDIDTANYIAADGTSYQHLKLYFDLNNLDTGETYTSCLGTEWAKDSKYYESYRLNGNELECAEYDDTTTLSDSLFTAIGTNIDSLTFSFNSTKNLLTATITPTGDDIEPIKVIFAQRQAILGLNE